MTITKEHADFAVRRLSCIPYFPSDEIAREEIARVLFRLVSHDVPRPVTLRTDIFEYTV